MGLTIYKVGLDEKCEKLELDGLLVTHLNSEWKDIPHVIFTGKPDNASEETAVSVSDKHVILSETGTFTIVATPGVSAAAAAWISLAITVAATAYSIYAMNQIEEPTTQTGQSANNQNGTPQNKQYPMSRIHDVAGHNILTPPLLQEPYIKFDALGREMQFMFGYVGVGKFAFSPERYWADDNDQYSLYIGDMPIPTISEAGAKIYDPGSSPNNGDYKMLSGQDFAETIYTVKRSTAVSGGIALKSSDETPVFVEMPQNSAVAVRVSEKADELGVGLVVSGNAISRSVGDWGDLKIGDGVIIDSTPYTFSSVNGLTIELYPEPLFNDGDYDLEYIHSGEIGYSNGFSVISVGDDVRVDLNIQYPPTELVLSGDYVAGHKTGDAIFLRSKNTNSVTDVRPGWASIDIGLNNRTAYIRSLTEAASAKYFLPAPLSDRRGFFVNVVASSGLYGDSGQERTIYFNVLYRQADKLGEIYESGAEESYQAAFASNPVIPAGDAGRLFSDVGKYYAPIAESLPFTLSGDPELDVKNSYLVETDSRGWQVESASLTGSNQDRVGATVEIETLSFGGEDPAIGTLRGYKTGVSVRVLRITEQLGGADDIKLDSISALHNGWWASESDPTFDFGNVTLWQARTIATSSATQPKTYEFRAECTRLLPWESDIHGPEVKNSRWIEYLIYAALDPKIGRLTDSQIDSTSMLSAYSDAYARFGVSNNIFASHDYCYDSDQLSFQDICKMVCESCFMVAYRKNGILGVRFEQPCPPSTMYLHRNKVWGQQAITRTMAIGVDNDGVELEWRNQETGDTETIITNPDAQRPMRVTTYGVTNKQKAWWLAMRQHNKLKYGRISMSDVLTASGASLYPADNILTTNDTLSNQQSGEVLAVNGLTLSLSQPVEFGDTNSITLNQRNGELYNVGVTAGADNKTVVLSEAPQEALYTGDDEDRTRYIFNASSNQTSMRIFVQEVDRGDESEIQIAGINYDERFYESDLLPVPE